MNVALNVIMKYWLPIIIGFAIFGAGIIGYLTGKDPKSKVLKDVDERLSTLSHAEAKSLSDRLWKEFDGLFGSDGDLVIQILKGLSLPDFKMVYEQFGKRRRDDILGVEGGTLFGNKERDLIYWIVAELSENELRELKDSNPNIPV